MKSRTSTRYQGKQKMNSNLDNKEGGNARPEGGERRRRGKAYWQVCIDCRKNTQEPSRMLAFLRRASGLYHIETKPGGFLSRKKSRIRANWYYLTWAKPMFEHLRREKWGYGVLDADRCDILALDMTLGNTYPSPINPLSKDLDHAIIQV